MEQAPVLDAWQSARVSHSPTNWHWVSQRSRLSLHWQVDDSEQSALLDVTEQLARHWPVRMSHAQAPLTSLLQS